MPTENRWEYEKSIMAHDDEGNSYEIVQERYLVASYPISGPLSGQAQWTPGKIRFTCEGEQVNQLPNRQYKLVQRGITLSPDSPGT